MKIILYIETLCSSVANKKKIICTYIKKRILSPQFRPQKNLVPKLRNL